MSNELQFCGLDFAGIAMTDLFYQNETRFKQPRIQSDLMFGYKSQFEGLVSEGVG